jgi:hypothetical protein
MHTIVLRGDWEKLCRRGDRVWVRVRPQEVVWKTIDDFTVDDIRAISIEPVQLELKRKSRVPGRGDTRVARRPITRVVIAYGTDGEDGQVKMDVHEPEDVVIDSFADLRDRFVNGAVAVEVDIDLVAEELVDAAAGAEHDEVPYISWKPKAEVAVERDADALLAVAATHDPELAREVSFKLELGAHPEAVGRWLDERVSPEDDADPRSWSDADLFGEEDLPEGGAFVLERRKRRLRDRLRGSGARNSR